VDIHRYDKRIIWQKDNVKRSEVSNNNKKLIFEFEDYCALQGMSKPRRIKYLEVLKGLAKILNKDFDKVDKDDITRVVREIQYRDYSEWTIQTYKVMLKRFYKWFNGDEEYPLIVRWINTNLKKSKLKLPMEGDLLTEDEVRRIIESANTIRDKAFISLLYESGCRVGEIGNLQLKHIKIDDLGALITVFGKTGARNIRVISSTPHLMSWMDNHPYKSERDCPIWVKDRKPLTYQYLVKILRGASKRAGISKRVNPHSFRHARATFLASHLTEFQMNQYFGWIQGSKMASTYVHMSGKEINNAILELNGIPIEKKIKESELKPIKCPRCSSINNAGSKYCSKCAGLLDVKEAMEIEAKREEYRNKKLEVDEVMSKLLQDPEVQKFIAQKMNAIS